MRWSPPLLLSPTRLLLLVVLLLVLLARPLAPLLSLASAAQSNPDFTPSLLVNSDPVSYYGLSDIALTYHLNKQNVNAAFDTFDSVTNALAIFTNSVDAAVISQPLTAAQRAHYPTVSAFPFLATAIMPIYHVSALASDAPTLVFTRAILVGIFSGTIRRWNDPLLAAANPTTALPNATITVVLPSTTRDHEISLCFTSALLSFSSANSSSLPFSPSATPAWPLSLYADYHIVYEQRIDSVASYVMSIDNTISFTALATALALSVNVGNVVNRAGNVVVASNTTVNYAVVELGAHSLQTSGSSVDEMDLNDAIGPLAWPICLASFFLVDLERSRSTCASRIAMVNFLLSTYESALAASVFQSHQYGIMPDIVVQALNIKQRLSTSILCEGSPAMPSSASLDVAVYGSRYITFMLTLLTFVYNQLDSEISYRFTPGKSNLAFGKVMAGEADVAVFYPPEIDPTALADAIASPTFMIVPLFLTSVAIAFNLHITPTVDLTGTRMRLSIDMPTLLLVLTQHITDWRDPSILALNSQLAALISSSSASNTSSSATAAPITPVLCCGGNCILTEHLVRVFTQYASRYNQSLLPFVAELSRMSTTLGVHNCVKHQHIGGIYWVPDELVMESAIDITVGAFGFVKDVQSAGDVPNQLSIWYPRRSSSSLSSTSSTPPSLYLATSSSRTLQACLDVFDYSTLTVDPSVSENTNCWPLAQVLYVGLRLSFSTSGAMATSCSRGIKTVQMMSWLTTLDDLSATTDAQNMVRTSILAPIKRAFVDKLNTSTCDGQPMLFVEPIVWKLAGGIASFAYAAGAIGMVYCMVSLALVVSHHKHPVIRSSSPIFLAGSLGGLMLFFVSTMLWVVEPSTASCSAFAWSLDLGFFLTFAPLFAKTWRIYCIFGGTKLKVVKITNAKLATTILCALAFELVILTLWQTTAPIHPVLTVQLLPITPVLGGSFQQHQYTQCGVDPGAGNAFLQYSLISKAILLLFGAMMAFSTRKVKSTFNESQPIAWSIYNVCFSAGILLPMMILLNQIGDVLTILLLFLLLWIGFFTMVTLTAGKFALVLNLVKSESPIEQAVSASRSGTNQFSFVSFANISSSANMRAYVRSLEDHLAAARQHLAKLVGREGGTDPMSRIGSRVASRAGALRNGGGGGGGGGTLVAIGQKGGDQAAAATGSGGDVPGEVKPLTRSFVSTAYIATERSGPNNNNNVLGSVGADGTVVTGGHNSGRTAAGGGTVTPGRVAAAGSTVMMPSAQRAGPTRQASAISMRPRSDSESSRQQQLGSPTSKDESS